jgi:membrane protease YdiL (CAAX protease family)
VTANPPTAIPPGWCADPVRQEDGFLRWWDGSVWTAHLRPKTVDDERTAEVAKHKADQATVTLSDPTRASLVWETRFVMVAFLVPGILAAIVLFAQHISGVGGVTRFPVVIKGHPVENLVFGMLSYLAVAAVVPLGLFLLNRTGQSPARLGLGLPSFKRDILPGLGLAGAAYGAEIVLIVPLVPVLRLYPSLLNKTPIGHVPSYYLIWGIFISVITAITEEVLVNGYLLTRLDQLGWSPRRALVLSLVLRTSYHIYYGLGFIFTVPFGYFVTRSFQKNRALTRPIVAHFLFDAILFTIVLLR